MLKYLEVRVDSLEVVVKADCIQKAVLEGLLKV